MYPVVGYGGGVYPGYGTRVVAGRAIPVPHQTPSQTPILSIFHASDPTYGQMKAILVYLMRFLRIGSRND